MSDGAVVVAVFYMVGALIFGVLIGWMAGAEHERRRDEDW